ncbi:hypothetical protein GCM10023095_00810 [Pseudaeromonas paramecii]|uniref:Capsular biosynthesis protein n=1 Tax=Pseudaeromonas paramecii TaxID=2138166 RepID=A0ABP8PW78_9GAMM
MCGGLFLANLLVTNVVRAAQEDNFILNASLGVMYDDNLFRLPEQASAVDGRGDTILTPTATLGYQQSFSKQQVSLSASAFSPRYQQHDTLNYHGYRLSTGWLGQVGKRWQPSLGYMKSRELSSYEDVQAGVMDMLSRQRFEGGLAYGRIGRIRLGADGWLEQKRHGSSTYEQLDLDDSGAGVQSEFASRRGSKVTLRYESRWIDYQQAAAQVLDYRLDKLRLSLFWPVSAKLEWSAVGGFMAWHFDGNDSSKRSWLGGTKFHWLPSDRWDLDLSYQRDSQDPGYNVRVSYSDTLALEAGWQLAQKWRLEGRVSQMWSQYGLDDTLGQERKDEALMYRMALIWQTTDKIRAESYWTLGKRDSNQANTDYDYQQCGLTFTYSY